LKIVKNALAVSSLDTKLLLLFATGWGLFLRPCICFVFFPPLVHVLSSRFQTHLIIVLIASLNNKQVKK